MLQFYTSENSDFEGYKIGTLARNGLKDFKKLISEQCYLLGSLQDWQHCQDNADHVTLVEYPQTNFLCLQAKK